MVILKKHYEAIGQSLLEGVQTVRMYVTEVDGFGKGQKYELIKKSPNKIRKEGTILGENFITAFDGDTAWTWQQDRDTVFRWLDQRQENLLYVQSIIGSPLALGEREGFYLEIIKSAYVDKVAQYVFRLDFPDGSFVDFYVDKKTFLIRKFVTYTDNSGEQIDREIFYSNYRKLGSFQFPYKFERKEGNNPPIDVIVGEIAVGVGAANGLFSPPVQR